MKKRTISVIVSAGVILLGAAGNGGNPQKVEIDSVSTQEVTSLEVESVPESAPKAKPTCDGVKVVSSCTFEGVAYSKFVYHPAVSEKTRTETVTTYRDEVSGYCTLCRDGTYSPSCATGRGACSHHGGVAQWNAPRYRRVPVTQKKTVVEAPAKEAYYEKVKQ